MEIAGRYYDGQIADPRDVIGGIEGAGPLTKLVLRERRGEEPIAQWPAADVYVAHGRRNELRIGLSHQHPGARFVVWGTAEMDRAHRMLPALDLRFRQERGTQARLVALGTAALASIVAAYVFGIPLLAGGIVGLVPKDWEERLGDTVAAQLERALADSEGFEICDPNPNSTANRAIDRFANAALAGAGSPFRADVKVIRSEVPNAFALPGGKAFYFSALLDSTETPDEFAGVLAHEMGHVAHRDSMEQLISTASTGLLIGFILGDMTGISVPGALGTMLVDSRFSREAEADADRFAADVARRMAFQPVGLANLLERVAKDDEFSRAFALLNTHPLTGERRAALEALTIENASLDPAFTPEEWQAIKAMCGRAAQSVPSTPNGGGAAQPSKADKNG